MVSNHDTENGTELNVPKWLTSEYFADILDDEFGEGKYIVKTFKVENAVGKGENFLSILFRVIIDVELKGAADILRNVNYLVKTNNSDPVTEEFNNVMSIFPKEIEMYSKIIGKMEKIYSDVGIKVKFAPKCYKVETNPGVIVMEDLKPKNFICADRLKGLDIHHAKYVLKRLAMFHAASVQLYETEGPFSDHFNSGILNDEMKEYFKDMMMGNKIEFMDSIREYIDDKELIQKIDEAQSHLFDQMVTCLDIDPTEFNVLNHGDLWTNNMMFSYDSNQEKIKEFLFIDLQVSKWGSPVQDIMYFILSSTSGEIKVKQFDYLVKFYHDALVENLKLLKYTKRVPTLIDLHCMLLRRGFYAYVVISGILSIVVFGADDDANMENFMRQDENGVNFRKRVWTNPRYIRVMKELLPFLNNRGALEI